MGILSASYSAPRNPKTPVNCLYLIVLIVSMVKRPNVSPTRNIQSLQMAHLFRATARSIIEKWRIKQRCAMAVILRTQQCKIMKSYHDNLRLFSGSFRFEPSIASAYRTEPLFFTPMKQRGLNTKAMVGPSLRLDTVYPNSRAPEIWIDRHERRCLPRRDCP